MSASHWSYGTGVALCHGNRGRLSASERIRLLRKVSVVISLFLWLMAQLFLLWQMENSLGIEEYIATSLAGERH